MSNKMKQEQPNFFGLFIETIQDVEDLSSENKESCMSDFLHVDECVNDGNAGFRENDFDKAIWQYSSAHSMKSNDCVILRNRCKGYIRKSLEQGNASDCQTNQYSELDSTTHAGLALKDADKLMSLEDMSSTTCGLKACALILLERLELAHDVIMLGLHADPLSRTLSSLATLTSRASGSKYGITLLADDLDCVICSKLLYEPMTTPCGHVFCRSCLLQALDRYNKCPMCRTVLFVNPSTCSISLVLDKIIQKNFPNNYAQRKLETDNLSKMDSNFMPLLVRDVLPCQKLAFNIIEPGHRLMVRRIMEGNKRIGIVDVDPITGLKADHACESEITDCMAYADGSFALEVESRKRCRILRNYDQDGYQVAETEWVQDACPADGKREQVLEMTKKAATWAKKWLTASHAAAIARKDQMRHFELLKAEGLMPSTSDPESFSFWLTTLTERRPVERLSVLRMRCSLQRLKYALFWMREVNDAGWQGA